MFFKLVLIFNMVFLAQAFAKPAPRPNCDIAKKFYNNGVALIERKQFLLSLQQFSLAENSDCAHLAQDASWGHLLALAGLNEKEEMFYLSVSKYTSDFSEENQSKLRLFQNYYFALNENTPEAARVARFAEWEKSLPPSKSPLLAGSLSALLPGAGQFYAGSWQSGTLAFVLNALFLSSTLELQKKDLHA